MAAFKYNYLGNRQQQTMDSETSAFDYSSTFNYESAFAYSKSYYPQIQEERTFHEPLAAKICTYILIVINYMLIVFTFPVSIKTLKHFERAVVYRIGHLEPLKGPGMIVILPFIDKWHKVDLRTKAFNVPPQQFLIGDGAGISVGANIYFRIADVRKSVNSVQDLNHSTRVLGHSLMVKALANKTTKELDTEKMRINEQLLEDMNVVTQTWGVEISRVELSEITVLKAAPESNTVQNIIGQLFSSATTGNIGLSTSNIPQPFLLPQPSSQAQPSTSFTYQNEQQSLDKAAVHRAVPSITPAILLASIKPLLNEYMVGSVGAVYKFIITGENGGTFFLDLKNGLGDAGVGEPPIGEPDVILELSTTNLPRLFSGQLKVMSAYMSGQLKVEGDRSAAMRLEEVMKELNKAMKV
ncbi:stomatin-like protein 1 [Anneissia japonica]|uniref:stomatin-like protein 1 n=1 Tax=Anneissia japonica TaxID=1529436 RepID=UPI0014257F33|nr:stomatin-like protein 1 [Anneissia japonica]XP_033123082.1 stomatin-like protein 1 [Anneissia japonica]